jgi:hypothetical protein
MPRSLKERVERLERTLDSGEDEQVFIVVYCQTPADVGMSNQFDKWLTRDEVLAETSGPPWCRTAYAHCDRERQARIKAAEGQGN